MRPRLLIALVFAAGAALAQYNPQPKPKPPIPQPQPPNPDPVRPPPPRPPEPLPPEPTPPVGAPAAARPGPEKTDPKKQQPRVVATVIDPRAPLADGLSEPLDFTRFLQVRSAWGPSFAPDGQRLSFLSNIPGSPQVFRLDRPGQWPHQVTFAEEYVSLVEWAPHGDRVAYARSGPGGSERWQIFTARADGEDLKTVAWDQSSVNRLGAWSRDGSMLAFSSNRRDKTNFDLYVHELGPNQTWLIHEGRSIWEALAFSPDNKKLLASRALSNYDNDLFLVDVMGKEAPRLLTAHTGEVRFESPQWSADGKTIYLACDRDRDFTNLAALDVASGEVKFLVNEPYDIDDIVLSRDGRRLAMVINVDGAGAIRVYDTRTWKVLGSPQLPPGLPKQLAISPDGKRVAFAFSGPAYNSDIWLFDVDARKLTQATFSPHAGINRAVFVQPELVRYPTFDGRELSGWLYKPRDSEAPAPVVVWLHGGPEAQERPDFSPVQQYLVTRGLAIFAPNIRGSTGYGKAFSHLDDRERRLDAVRDVEVSVRMLRGREDVDASRIAVLGGSAGGYLALLSLTRNPELWTAGVDIAGIVNLETYFKTTDPWRVAVRAVEYGDPVTQKELVRALSPIHEVSKIRAPLIVVQGQNDIRVPVGEAEQIVSALKTRQIPAEYLLFADEGHGVVKLQNRVVAWTRIGDFLLKHLRKPAGTAQK